MRNDGFATCLLTVLAWLAIVVVVIGALGSRDQSCSRAVSSHQQGRRE